MAGKGWRRFTRETLASQDVQEYLMDQAVMVFPSASARDAELTTPADGMVVYLEDVDDYVYREGGAFWRPLGPRWPGQGTGDPFPSTGVRSGEFLYSYKYECVVMYEPTADAWRQATPVVVSSLSDYVTRLVSRGVTNVHNGFQVFQTQTNRLFASTGVALSSGTAAAFVQVGGEWGGAQTTGFQNVTGWNYNGSASNVRTLGGGLAQFYVEATKATSALSVPTNGNVANSVIGKLPAGLEAAAAVVVTSGASGRGCWGIVDSTGNITLTATTPDTSAGTSSGGTIAVGETISLGGIYRLANNLL